MQAQLFHFRQMRNEAFSKVCCHIVAVVILLCSLGTRTTAQSTIAATATQPNVYGGCIDSVFTLTYFATDTHTLGIDANLYSQQGVPNNCEGQQAIHPQVVIIFDTLNFGNVTNVDSANGTITFHISAINDTVRLTYRVLIDCTVLSKTNAFTTYNLQQIFTINIANTTLAVNGGGNTTLRSNLSSPTVQLDNGNTPYYVSYLNTNYITVRYTNYSGLPAHIRFRYNAGDTLMCGFGVIDSFAYSTDNTNFTNYSQNTVTSVVIPPNGGSLYIRQRAIEDSCIYPICTDTCTLQWQCDYAPVLGNLFCDACVQQEVFDYYTLSNDLPRCSIIAVSPATNSTQDYSCFNDTANMVNWEYIVVHQANSVGATDTLTVMLHPYGVDDVTDQYELTPLNLIPQSSIQVTRTGSSALVDTFLFSTPKLCSNYVPDPLKYIIIKATDFMKGDTLRLKFKTFRCAGDSDAALLNQPKLLNHWVIEALPLSICGSSVNEGAALSTELLVGHHNIHQQLQMFPSTTQLTVPVDSVFGDSVQLQIDVRKFVNINNAGMFQYLGCTHQFTDTACHASGIWRVKVTLGTGLRIQQPWQVHLYKDSTVTVTIYPDYYNDDVNDTMCESGTYYFYFHLSDTLKMMMEQGTIAMTLQSCCDTLNDEPVHIDIASYIMPDATGSCNGAIYPTNTHDSLPTFNVGQAFIPLASAEHDIHVHCPGCKAPGVIADRYRLSRTSFGLQDGNNDGIADDSLLLVQPGNWYYANHNKSIARNNSSVGDTLRDYVTAHLQDGDPTIGGYSYAQMQQHGAILNYLNIGVTIPSAFDTINLMPDGYDFYIDIDTALAPCIDCDKFEVSANYKTILHIFVPTANMATYMQMVTTQNKFYYTFSALDTSAQYILNPSYIVYNDGTFTGFDVNQRYRLSTRYKECGTWAVIDKPVLADVMRKKEIEVQTWMSGEPKPYNAFSFGIDMPNDTNDLDSMGWTFNQNFHPDDSLVNQTFANSFIFFCEFTGATHYFFSQDVWMGGVAYKSNDDNCGINLEIKTTHRTAGDLLDIYPFEYRPPALNSKEVSFYVPQGYTPVATAYYYNTFGGAYNGVQTHHTPFTLPTAINDSITILYNTLLPPACWSTSDYNGTFADTLPYIKDGLYYNTIIVNFEPINCDSKTLFYADTCVYLVTDTATLDSMNNSFCSYQDTLHAMQEEFSHTSKANLQVIITPSTQNVYTHRICWTIEIRNPKDTVDSVLTNPTTYLYTHAAPNVYIPIPNVSWLSNWTFTPNGGLPISSIGNYYIPVQNLLLVDNKIEGQLCADYNTCKDSIAFDIIAGYNCAHYPDTPIVFANVCDTVNWQVVIEDDSTAIATNGKVAPTNYSLCKPFVKMMDIYRSGKGEVYIDSVLLNNLPPQFTVNNVWVKSAKNLTDSVILSTTTEPHHWFVDSTGMATLGFTSGTLFGDSAFLYFYFEIEAHCEIYNGQSPHTITVHGRNFCNDTLSATTNGSLFTWDSTNFCTDCFTITKTANTDTINVNDTITYTITVIANNGSQTAVIVTDTFPNNFVVIPPNPFPAYLILSAQDTAVINVQGYFTNVNDTDGTCNVAILTNGTDTITDTSCVQVNPPCFKDTYKIIEDSIYSSSLAFSNYTGDTIILKGRFYIDADFTFNNCVIIAYPASNIITLGNAIITVTNTVTYSCTQMWKGFYLEETAIIKMTGSHIYDAENGVWARKSNGVYLTGNAILNCITGVRMQEPNMVNKTNKNNCYGYIYDNEIAQTARLKPWYAGQPFTDTVMYASIYLQNVKFDIGDMTKPKNKLHHAANGVIAHNAITKIRNTEASFIRPLSTNGNKRSAAFVAMSDTGSLITNMTVLPLTNTATATVHDSWRGVYGSASHLTVIDNIIRDVAIGVSVNNNHNMQKVNIVGNLILAGSRGISCNNNAGGAGVNIENNVVVMSGTSTAKGINVNETNNLQTTNYTILANHVTMNNARSAIEVNNTYKTLIASNTVKLISSIDTVTNGISLNGCKQANVNCNYVKGSNPTDTNAIGLGTQVGIATSQTDFSTIQCNTVDSTAYGFFFGGSCLGTTFRGNDMYKHLHSLYLNKVAVIDTQQHAGNRWNDLTNPFNAVNQNDNTQFDLEQSLFITNPASGLVYNPTYPTNSATWPYVNDQGWFFTVNGVPPFLCGNTLCRDITSNINISPDILHAIVGDSVITSFYLAESQTINQNTAYEAFMRDSVLWMSSQEYIDFVAAQHTQATGMLFDVKAEFVRLYAYDASFIEQVTNIDSLIFEIVQRINEYDSLALLNSAYVNNAVRTDYLNQLQTQFENRLNLFYAHDSNRHIILADAAQSLLAMVTGEIPQINEKIMYNVEIDILQNSTDVLENYLADLFYVGSQCPYSGGNAVYKARAYLETLFDTIYWDDANVCFNEGIYRNANNSETTISNSITVKPNPSNGILEIFKTTPLKNNCIIKIKNAIGKNVYEKQIDCAQGSQFIDVRILANGVYTIIIISESETQFTQKVIILK